MFLLLRNSYVTGQTKLTADHIIQKVSNEAIDGKSSSCMLCMTNKNIFSYCACALS